MVLWFWFIFLFIVTLIYLKYQISLILLPCLRQIELRQLAPSTDKQNLKKLSSTPGRWFISRLLSNNIEATYFRDIMELVIEHEHQLIKKTKSMKNSRFIRNDKKDKVSEKRKYIIISNRDQLSEQENDFV